MPAPNVFISSTFYDLRYIRENLEFFVRSLGYNPVLSERGSIYYDPEQSAANAAVAEVSNCQLFVLIIGGRFGMEAPDADHSVTNAEYKEAVRRKTPVFALVEQGAYADYDVWRANADRDPAGLPIAYPNVDDSRVLEFIHEVRGQAVNNALFSFRDFEDIQTYLRQQWSGMLYSFLLGSSEAKRVEETLGALELISRRVEVLSSQILESVGSTEAKATAEMYDLMLVSPAVREMTRLGIRPAPGDVLQNATFTACTDSLGAHWEVLPEDSDAGFIASLSGNKGEMASDRAAEIEEDYRQLREKLEAIQAQSGAAVKRLTTAADSPITMIDRLQGAGTFD